MHSEGIRDLGLTTRGGDGCACCAPGGHHSDHAVALDTVGDGAVTTLMVEGMTCAHCVSSVTEEVSEVEGVGSVSVELVVGGASTVRVIAAGDARPDADALRAAVEEAGYTLAPRP
ncbi:heavy-metal-associated domain-containing protein [Herbiconiux sp. A18JL235]|uniref:Heavy-metal-associated domain-containing protein n=1 Tax=Herbiconiux sp. A18JL235 TaxID=3152363 RepID=A0AB39BJL7_9MICO